MGWWVSLIVQMEEEGYVIATYPVFLFLQNTVMKDSDTQDIRGHARGSPPSRDGHFTGQCPSPSPGPQMPSSRPHHSCFAVPALPLPSPV